ncbi:hypothetical protein SPHINGO391_460137 [Sphingomonas aurantiaca]|uniref:Uncharacterized protein n=1 Tax=Sphingomonas aurantiaca TaxID=185949 RepID=A0A5E7ZKI5_9SPHN|nr:hypothetical protein SPHINGO391_460137 [Sphingomonas aurantiaca]
MQTARHCQSAMTRAPRRSRSCTFSRYTALEAIAQIVVEDDADAESFPQPVAGARPAALNGPQTVPSATSTAGWTP